MLTSDTMRYFGMILRSSFPVPDSVVPSLLLSTANVLPGLSQYILHVNYLIDIYLYEDLASQLFCVFMGLTRIADEVF